MKKSENSQAPKTRFALPKEWYVVAPVAKDRRLSAEMLRQIPRLIEAGGKKLAPKKVEVENGRLDLTPFLGGTGEGRSALIYIPFTSDRGQTAIFGCGANWWFEAYLDGTRIYDTLQGGNLYWPLNVANHLKTVDLSKGPHLLVIRFISGMAAPSVLCVACSNDMNSLHSQVLHPQVLSLQQMKSPESSLFMPIKIKGGVDIVSRGIPFVATTFACLKDKPVTVAAGKIKAKWLIYLHVSGELPPVQYNENGFTASSSKGREQLGKLIARYAIKYADGTECAQPVRQRFEIGSFRLLWGAGGLGCVRCIKPYPVPAHHEQLDKPQSWFASQTRVVQESGELWLYAWENPYPEKEIVTLRFESLSVPLMVYGITAGNVASHPLRWETRKKAVLTLPDNACFNPGLDDNGLLDQIQLDLGQVISARPRLQYDHGAWRKGFDPASLSVNPREILIEYTAHPEASFHLPDGMIIPAASLGKKDESVCLRPVKEASQLVRIRVVEKGSQRCVPVRLHLHGAAGEYLAPTDRHRIPNPSVFEDYSTDYVQGNHWSTYITGETTVMLPAGRVYAEVTKGFEIRPVRQVIKVNGSTRAVTIQVENALNWREKGWVTADTHVHFLSPPTALLEGEAEGVNVVNLLATQLGELMTNVGDFDGKTTFGARQAGGSGEYFVRVGTENRQCLLGHISLLGYEGPIIAPMTTGGPAESALGDPVWTIMTQWAEQCKKQKGLVIIPHFPVPRLENAAVIVSGNADAVEFKDMISPYSLSDWYRYLNCGYMAAAVGGTDKMAASQAVGKIRTYAYIGRQRRFTYELWKDAVRSAATFVTTGPLIEFRVEGKMMGARIRMKSTGGTVGVTWEVASIVTSMAKVELVRNGEIIEAVSVEPQRGKGNWEVKVTRSSWLALLVRDAKGQIAAHSSPVMVEVAGSAFYAAADAMTILEQIEGAIAYIDTIGTRAETKRFKAMKLKLTSIHRALHNRMHGAGVFHGHSPKDTHEHPDHGK